jgi:cytochrome c556
MRNVVFIIGVCIVVASTLTIVAQQAPKDLSPIMKDIAHSVQELNRAMAATGAPIVVKEAENLQQRFAEAEAFFKAQNALDAVEWAHAQAESAAAIAKTAQANNLDGAKAPIKTMTDRCNTCHMVHREQLPDKTFRFKP